MRWVLIRPLNHSPYYDPEIQEPLGLEYLAAALRQRRDEVLILDCSLDAAGNVKVARRALSFRPDVVGFSITTAQELDSVRAIHDECRRGDAAGTIRWLAGGNWVSSELGQAERRLPAEFQLVPYEGERALDELSRLWAQAVPANSTLGQRGGPEPKVVPGKPVHDLDQLPFPERPFAAQILGSGWAFNLQGSRGCCGNCHYCSSPGMNPRAANRWRGRSPAHIVAEIELLCRRCDARSFNFVDEDFLGPPRRAAQRAEEFVRTLAAHNLRVSFSIQVRPATLNDEVIATLARAGLTYVFMGLESDDPADFRRWNRPYSANAWKVVARLREHGVELNTGVMLFHPHATLAGIRRFASRLRQHDLLDFRTAINRLDAMPGSKFYRDAMASGALDRDLCGPQPLPYLHPEVEPLHADLIAALEPLGPPSMHALCALPPLLAHRRLGDRAETGIDELRRIGRSLDEAVAATLFSLLDFHENDGHGPGIVDRLRRRNLRAAVAGAEELAISGFVRSFAELREAIRTDSGL
jgi:anaerobic magnesium-protoporphyrin IX monomethyl ester cyclase